MKNNKKILWILGSVLFAIWGTVLIQIISVLYGNNGEESEMRKVTGANHSQTRLFQYQKNVPDPFQFYLQRENEAISKKVNKAHIEPVWSPPPYRLSGIIINDKKGTVLLEATNGSVFFLEEGDTLAGILIKKIGIKKAAYRYSGKMGEWEIP